MAKFGKSLFPLSIFFLAFERDRLAPNDLDSKRVRVDASATDKQDA